MGGGAGGGGGVTVYAASGHLRPVPGQICTAVSVCFDHGLKMSKLGGCSSDNGASKNRGSVLEWNTLGREAVVKLE